MVNWSENWALHIEPGVIKVLKKIPRHDAEVIGDVIHLLPANPYFGDIEKMKGEDNVYRRRIGAYRLFYKLKFFERVILVFRLERRTSNTY